MKLESMEFNILKFKCVLKKRLSTVIIQRTQSTLKFEICDHLICRYIKLFLNHSKKNINFGTKHIQRIS